MTCCLSLSGFSRAEKQVAYGCSFCMWIWRKLNLRSLQLASAGSTRSEVSGKTGRQTLSPRGRSYRVLVEIQAGFQPPQAAFSGSPPMECNLAPTPRQKVRPLPLSELQQPHPEGANFCWDLFVCRARSSNNHDKICNKFRRVFFPSHPHTPRLNT